MERNSSNVSYLQTAGRALEILNMFQTENSLSLNAIAKGLGVGTTVAYRLVYTLTAEGFLHQDAASKQYMLGDKAMILGFCAVYRNDVKRIAHDLIWQFYEQTGYSMTMTMLCDMKSLCIEHILSSRTGLTTTMFTGGLYPLHKGASNRVLLAFMPEDEREAYLAGLGMAAEDEARLRASLGLARRRGYDFTKNDMPGGLFAIGFPVFNSANRLVAGISCGGRSVDMTEELLDRMLGEARALALQINNRMGATCMEF